MQQQRVFLNKCSLFIEQINLNITGHFYFTWKKGKKYAETQRFFIDEDQKSVSINHTLSMNLKLYKQLNGQYQQKNTHLYLMEIIEGEDDPKEVWTCDIGVQEYEEEYIAKKLQIRGKYPQKKQLLGNVFVQVRKTQVMQLENFQKFSAEIEESSAQTKTYTKNTLPNKNKALSNSEYFALKNELEDLRYLTEKLKSDRNTAMAANKLLSEELALLKESIKQEMQRLVEFYNSREQIRQSIYSEQLQNLINIFNSNSEINMKILKGCLEDIQNYKISIKTLNIEHEVHISDLKEQFQHECDQLHNTIENLRNKIQKNESEYNQLFMKNKNLKKQFEEAQKLYEKSNAEHDQTLKEWRQKQDQLILQMERLQQDLNKEKINSQSLQMQNDEERQNVKLLKEQIQTLHQQIQNLNRERMKQQQTVHNLQDKIQQYELEKVNLGHQIETKNLEIGTLESQIKTLAKESQEEIKKNQKNVQDIEKSYTERLNQMNQLLEETREQGTARQTEQEKKINEMFEQISKEREQNQLLEIEKERLVSELQGLKLELSVKNQEYTDEVAEMEQQIREERRLREQNDENMEALLTQRDQQHEKDIQALQNSYASLEKEHNEARENLQKELEEEREQNLKMIQVRNQLEVQKNNLEIDVNYYSRINEDLKKVIKEYDQFLDKGLRELLEDKDNPTSEGEKKVQFMSLIQAITQNAKNLTGKNEEAPKNPQPNPLLNLLGNMAASQAPVKSESSQETEFKPEQILKEIFSMTKNKNTSLIDNIDKMKTQLHEAKEKELEQQAQIEELRRELELAQEDKLLKQQQLICLQKNLRDKQIEIEEIKAELSEKKESHEIFSLSETKGRMSSELGFSSKDDFRFGKSPSKDSKDGVDSSQNISKPKSKGKQRRYSRDGGFLLQPNFMIDEQESKLQELELSNLPPQQNQQQIKKVKKERKKLLTPSKMIDSPRLHKELEVESSDKDYDERYEEDITSHNDNYQIYDLKNEQNDQQKEEIENRKMQIDENFDRRGQMYENNSNFSLGLTQKLQQSLNNSNKQIKILQLNIANLQKQLKDKENNFHEQQQKLEETQLRVKDLFNQLSVAQQQLFKKKSDSPTIMMKQQEEVSIPKNDEWVKMLNNSKQQAERERETNRRLGEQIERLTNTLQNKKQSYNILEQQMNLMKKQLQEESKKSKILEQEQKSNNNRYGLPLDISKILQEELEQLQRKVIDLTKQSTNYRLEKQSFADELSAVNRKSSEYEKNRAIAEGKVQSLNQQIQELQYRMNKYKYDLQNKEYETSKHIEQRTRLQLKIKQLVKSSDARDYDYKKLVEEKYKFENQVDKKNGELQQAKKEIRRLQEKYRERETLKYERKTFESKQRQRLDTENYTLKKQIQELSTQIEQLKRNLEAQERSHKHLAEEEAKSFTQKLRSYQNQVQNLRNVINKTESDLHYLKVDNYNLINEKNEFEQDLFEMQKIREKLQDQLSNFEGQIAEADTKIYQLQKQNNTLIGQLQRVVGQLCQFKVHMEKQKEYFVKKSERFQEYQILNQKYIYEINGLKSKINQYKQKEDFEDKLIAHKKQLQANYQELSTRFIELTKEHEKYRLEFVYRREEVEELCQQIKDSYEESARRECQNIQTQLQNQFQQKISKMQEEIVKLYNENSKLGIEVNRKSDEYANLNQQLLELQKYPHMYKQLKEELQALTTKSMILESDCLNLNKELEATSEVLRKYERQLGESTRDLKVSTRDIAMYQQKSQTYKQKLVDVEKTIQSLRKELNKAKQQRDQVRQQLASTTQNLSSKILSLELQNQRIKEREINVTEEARQKIGKLEKNLKQAESVMNKLNTGFKAQQKKFSTDKERTIKLLQQQLQQAKEESRALSITMNTLKLENTEFTTEIANLREQLAEDEQVYLMEINKLKNNIQDNEQIYTMNLNNLEEELAVMNRQLTEQRLNKNISLRSSKQKDTQIERRYEEKIRSRQSKIEELTIKILSLEQQLNKNENTYHEHFGEDNKYRKMCDDLQKKIRNEHEIHMAEKQQQKSIQKNLKKQLANVKNEYEQIKLLLEQKTLELQSLSYELNTFKELYKKLQQEIDNRKIRLHDDLKNYQTIQIALNEKENTIKALEEENVQINVTLDIVENRLKKKEEEADELNRKYQQILQRVKVLQAEKNELLIKISKANRQNQDEKNKSVYQMELLELKQIHNEQILKMKTEYEKQIEHLKVEQRNLRIQSTKLMNQLMTMEPIVAEYEEIKRICAAKYETDPLTFIDRYGQQAEANYIQKNQLKEELEELKFMYEQKQIDYEELHKNNIALQLKSEDYDYISEQVEALRKICDKLEDEKKRAEFEYSAIALKIENAIEYQSMDQKLRYKLQAIVTEKQYDHDA